MPYEEIIKTLFIFFVAVAGLTPILTWIERKQSAVMQDRIGANRADVAGITILGLFHPVADVVKLITKEDVVPDGANRVLHTLALTYWRTRSRRAGASPRRVRRRAISSVCRATCARRWSTWASWAARGSFSSPLY